MELTCRGALPLLGLRLSVDPGGIPRGKRPSSIGQSQVAQLTRCSGADADPTPARAPVQIRRCRLVHLELDPFGHVMRVSRTCCNGVRRGQAEPRLARTVVLAREDTAHRE